MPLVEVELVSDQPTVTGLAAALADAVGHALAAAEGSTWVRLRLVPRGHYAESGGPVDDSIRPVFVTITAHRRPDGPALAQVVNRVTSAVAEVTGHPAENVHLLFAPDAAGRIAFGGKLRD